MKVLQLAYKLPFPQHDGGSYSIYNSATNMMDAGLRVKTLAMQTQKDVTDASGAFDDFIRETRFESVDTDTRVKPFRAAVNLLKRESYFIERFYSHAFEQKLTDTLLRNRFDIVVLEHLYLCPYIDIIRAYSDAKIVLRAQNIEHRLWEKYLQGVKNPFKRWFLKVATDRLKTYECRVVNELDGIMALTAEDAAFFKYKTGKVPVAEIPVGFIDSHKEKAVVRPKNDLPVLFHLGSMDWLPNIEGIDWFIDSVLPLVAKKYPGIQFHMAGKKMPDWYLDMHNKNVVVEGRVNSAKKYMSNKDILIVPLLSGGGIRVKIIEAMAYGKTVISTTTGAKGIHLQNNRHVLIGDTAVEFASQIIRCIESPELRNSIAQNGFEMVNAHYGQETLSQKIKVFFNEVLRKVNSAELVPETMQYNYYVK